MMEDIGEWVRLGPVLLVAQKGPPLASVGKVLMEVEADGTTPVREDEVIVG